MITVVSTLSNVDVDKRLVVAPIGATVLKQQIGSKRGEGEVVSRTTIAGVTSEGVFCDHRMLAYGSSRMAVGKYTRKNSNR